eukprot:m.365629 g.365629  ORF g.365629 m.365629 type:complete len:84 (+) comp16656_c0_seq21:2165-2416(+)
MSQRGLLGCMSPKDVNVILRQSFGPDSEEIVQEWQRSVLNAEVLVSDLGGTGLSTRSAPVQSPNVWVPSTVPLKMPAFQWRSS